MANERGVANHAGHSLFLVFGLWLIVYVSHYAWCSIQLNENISCIKTYIFVAFFTCIVLNSMCTIQLLFITYFVYSTLSLVFKLSNTFQA